MESKQRFFFRCRQLAHFDIQLVTNDVHNIRCTVDVGGVDFKMNSVTVNQQPLMTRKVSSGSMVPRTVVWL